MDAPPELAKPATGRAHATRRQLAAVLVVLGVTWTILTGACTGGFALFTTGVGLIFGAPLVLGGCAVWIAGGLLKRDPLDEAVGRQARVWAIVSALGTIATIGFAIWSAQQVDEYGLSQMLAIFAAAGAVGGAVLLATSLVIVLAPGKTTEGSEGASPPHNRPGGDT